MYKINKIIDIWLDKHLIKHEQKQCDWRILAGDNIAKYSFITDITNDALEIGATNSLVLQEIKLNTKKILYKLNANYPSLNINKINLKILSNNEALEFAKQQSIERVKKEPKKLPLEQKLNLNVDYDKALKDFEDLIKTIKD